MIYKIYPVSEEKWLLIWKRIKAVCKKQGLQIVKVDCEDFKGQCDSLDSYANGGQTTIIYIAEQIELFQVVSNVVNIRKNKDVVYPKRDAKGHFARRG